MSKRSILARFAARLAAAKRDAGSTIRARLSLPRRRRLKDGGGGRDGGRGAAPAAA
ncbi:MAG TPA: hypothetical protein VEB20_09950 [Azospirillaceae bacterium]|nr:hypothetical protein [Azospirillaceae bacterium]